MKIHKTNLVCLDGRVVRVQMSERVMQIMTPALWLKISAYPE